MSSVSNKSNSGPISKITKEFRIFLVAGIAMTGMVFNFFKMQLASARRGVEGDPESIGVSDESGTLEVDPKLKELLRRVSSTRYGELERQAKSCFHASDGGATQEPVQRFHDQALCKFPVDPALVDAVRSDLTFDLDVANRHARLDWHGNPAHSFSDYLATQAPTRSQLENTYKILYETEVNDIVRNCLGFDFTIYNFRLVKSLPHVEKAFGPQAYHYDGCPPGLFRLIIYLTDVDEETGPFEYISDGEKKFLTAPANTGFLFDANRLIHRGSPPKGKIREAMDFVIGPRPPGSPPQVIWSGMNNWPVDPFHYSTDGCEICRPNS